MNRGFPLAGLLRLRHLQEEQAAAELARANAERRAADRRRRDTAEALAGTRPLAQLVRWVSPAVLDALASRTSPSPAPRALRRTTIRRTHVCRIDARTAEASVVVHDGDRVRAAAVRLEARRGHWRATALQIG